MKSNYYWEGYEFPSFDVIDKFAFNIKSGRMHPFNTTNTPDLKDYWRGRFEK